MKEESVQTTIHHPKPAARVGTPAPRSHSRRKFMSQVSFTGASALATGAVGIRPLFADQRDNDDDDQSGSNRRAQDCLKIRKHAAQQGFRDTPNNLQHPTNADESHPKKIGSYSKGLPHNGDGTVDLSAYAALTRALERGRPSDFNAIPMGGNRKLTSPQAGLAFDMEGPDAHALVQPPAPAFATKEQVAEIAENYWMALLRDVPFSDYTSHAMALAAAADLTSFGAAFKGAKNGGVVTPQLLFRGLTPSDRVGPYLSQYFYLPCFFGANEIDQKIATAAAFSNHINNGGSAGGRDYLTTFSDWLSSQRGFNPPAADIFDPTRRYMRMGRDIGQWVHIDVLFQGYFQAFLVLASLGAPFDDGNPYVGNPTQDGFATFGGPHIATLLCEVSTRALKAVWFQKWFVHRRLRPEAFAGRIERNRTHPGSFNIHPSLNASTVLPAVQQHNAQLNGGPGTDTYLLPMAFPEGCPTHPAYGAGHATVAGACVTILKAWFKESTPIASLIAPEEPSPDGLALVSYTGADAAQMTVGGELNKVASNVALGRDIAGVHWRSDATESLRLGEQVAIGILKDQRACYNENFNGFSLTKFDGTTVTV